MKLAKIIFSFRYVFRMFLFNFSFRNRYQTNNFKRNRTFSLSLEHNELAVQNEVRKRVHLLEKKKKNATTFFEGGPTKHLQLRNEISYKYINNFSRDIASSLLRDRLYLLRPVFTTIPEQQ